MAGHHLTVTSDQVRSLTRATGDRGSHTQYQVSWIKFNFQYFSRGKLSTGTTPDPGMLLLTTTIVEENSDTDTDKMTH